MDLGIEINPVLWNNICRNCVTCTLNSRYSLTLFNFGHQIYLTPSKLHGFHLNVLPLCFRCGRTEGTFLHSTWECSKFGGFLQGMCAVLSTIHGDTFPVDLEICLLGNLSKSNVRHSHSIKLTEILLAKKCIAVKWKSNSYCQLDCGYQR